MKNFITRGKKGDLHMLLYVVKQMGGGNLLIAPGEFEEPLESILESCSRLVCAQNYIHRFDIYKGEFIDVDLDLYRKSSLLYRTTLLEVISSPHGLKIKYPVEPWIDVPPDPRFKEKIILHRRKSVVWGRENKLFNWKQLLENIGYQNCIFVSRLKEEWNEFGFPQVEYYCPKDNYEHAQIIKASRLFIGNQSFPSALADALGVNRIFELSTGLDRKHFQISYADNVWYFANPWNGSIKNFRYLKIANSKSYHDLSTGEIALKVESYFSSFWKTIFLEIRFQWFFCREMCKRFVKYVYWKKIFKSI
ncbi:MAG: hypothetical protein ACD_7C00378G0001 [uncultured bacterium]|nr:MAG: hypothetical protein ACD_7C00378G0001 [uncultured bacterium]OGQ07211.1 MAG: hypothetical protein A3C45_08460 [Deltaproteobacteria bacterium RIFCSPHIGHO2_02_FULL_40_28]OGQ19602.1 MAG: hypothetical protein A3E27_07655 [Deltaproteobacteria bacterium RIFCSPHIGHO2_12_FULL_40_32]OGQ40879.1 MAG: hypothetical protein A3I69_03070 [Deltaproteobacteria bacterium RIFCSPLOWO2_02_FULL_40_36]OGQ53994.1 MAG: hypothetical protein A3G32_04350 [Deltaproteobacteria bacterium RIFCSPLOWO2_12_FULL_40_28]